MLFISDITNYILPIFIVNFIMGLVSYPVANRLFNSLQDKGYTAGHILGWIVVSFISFLMGWNQFTQVTVVLALLIWCGFNFTIYLKDKERPKLTHIICSQIGYLFILIFFVFLKGSKPDIYSGERLMDFGILKSLENTSYLPLYDFWMSGKQLNYYYFGQVIGSVMLKLGGLNVLSGYHVLTALVYSLLSVALFVFGYDFLKKLLPNSMSRITCIVSGGLSTFFVLYAGTFYTIAWFLRNIYCKLSGCDQVIHPNVFSIGYIKGTIIEIPIATFFIAENHAHMWGMLFTFLTILISYIQWHSKSFTKLSIVGGFILGVSIMTNAWNIAILLPFYILMLFLGSPCLRSFFKQLIITMAVLLLSVLPWLINYSQPTGGIGIVEDHSLFRKWLIIWGFFLITLFLFSIQTYKNRNNKSIAFIYMIFITFVVTAVFTEIVYIKDIVAQTIWYRTNTVFKLGYVTWFFMGAISGPTLTFLFIKLKSKILKATLLLMTISQALYIILLTCLLIAKPYVGITKGLEWWGKKYPYDFAAYIFMEKHERSIPVIIEATNFDAYKDSKFFSAYLGWKSVLGFFLHESAWRGRFGTGVITRAVDIEEFYTGESQSNRIRIIHKYNVNYIVLGELEKQIYREKLKSEDILKLGSIFYKNDITKIIKVY